MMFTKTPGSSIVFMPLRVVPLAKYALILAAGLGVAAGGGPSSNGVEAKPADAIVAASKQAADAANSVHIAGSIATKRQPTKFDLSLVTGKGGRGTLSVNGLSLHLIRIGSTIYVKGSPAFYQHYAGAAARLLRGKWLRGPATSGSFASIGPFTNLVAFVDNLLATSPSVTLTKGAATTLAGQTVIQVTDGRNETLSVATTGEPYPVQITRPGSSGGTITFDRWNAPVRLAAPHHSINLNLLKRSPVRTIKWPAS